MTDHNLTPGRGVRITDERHSGEGHSGRRVYIKTYGCQMNVYDSERIAELLAPIGYAAASAPDEADLIVVNTCHIREKASEKLYSDLGRLRPIKARGEAKGKPVTIAVAGCVAQAEGAEIAVRAPVVDLILGPQSYHRLPELIARSARERGATLDTDFAVEEKFDRLGVDREPAGVTAFLTVQEGCDKFCTFCVVPYTRGPEAARSAVSIIGEAESLVARGVREITLLGQNVNAWAATPAPDEISSTITPRADGKWGLAALCRRLASIDQLDRIRFTTSHPRDMDDELIAAFGELSALMPYLHLPVQSGSDRILKAMNRGHTAADYRRMVEAVRRARPDIALSGDFIVGFPGETKDDFEETMRLVHEVGFASAFAFKYSRRPGTPASAMGGQVSEDEKDRRLAKLLDLLDTQRRDFNASLVGAEISVLFEKPGRMPGQMIGRTPYLQSVHVSADASIIGTIKKVRIVGVTSNALAGELVDRLHYEEAPNAASAHELASA